MLPENFGVCPVCLKKIAFPDLRGCSPPSRPSGSNSNAYARGRERETYRQTESYRELRETYVLEGGVEETRDLRYAGGDVDTDDCS